MTVVLVSEVSPIVLPGHSGEGGKQQQIHPVNPTKPMRNPPASTDISLELSFMPPVSKQHIGGRISHYFFIRTYTNDSWVPDTVMGYKIEFLEFAHQSYNLNMHSSEEERDLINQEVLSITETCYSQGFRTQWS